MMKFLKLLGLACVLALLSVTAGLVALKIWVGPEKLKSLALNALHDALGREVRLDSVSLGWRGLALSGFSVSNIPDFKAGTFLEARHLDLRPRLRPLLDKRLEVAELSLSGWHCRIELPPGPLGGKSSPPKAATHVSSRETAWTVTGLSASDGELIFVDKSQGTALTLSRIELSSRGLKAKGEFPLTLRFEYHGSVKGAKLSGNMDFKGSLDAGSLISSEARILVESLGVEANGLGLTLSGRVEDLSQPSAALKIRVPARTAQELKAAGLSMAFDLPALEGSLEARSTARGLELSSIDIRAQKLRLTPGLPALDWAHLKGSVSLKPEEIQIKAAELQFSGIGLRASGRISLPSGKTPDIDVEVATIRMMDLSGLRPWSKALAAAQASGSASLEARIKGSPASPQVSGTVQLSATAWTQGPHQLNNLGGAVSFSPKEARGGVSGLYNGAPLELRLEAKGLDGSADYRLEGSLARLDLGGLSSTDGESNKPLSEKSQPDQTQTQPFKSSGNILITKVFHPNFEASDTRFSWALSVPQDARRLSGSAQLKLGPGRFDNLKGLGDKNALVKALLLPVLVLQKAGALAKVPLLPAFDKVIFKEITGRYAFQNGLMTIEESHMDSNAGYVTASGTADIPGDSLDMRVETRMLPQTGVKLGGPLGFTVKGPLSSPNVRPDIASILKQPVVNDALEQGKKLLKGLLQ